MIEITKEGKRWVAKFPYNYNDKELVKGYGFRWNPMQKIWWTSQQDKAMALAIEIDDQGLITDIKQCEQEQELNNESSYIASQSLDSNINIPAPSGLKYLPYQKAGIEYALGKTDTLIADEMGLGKTIQAIGICNSDDTLKNVLIFCPKGLKINWVNEWKKWDVKGLTVDYNKNGKPLPDTNVVILNFDVAKKFTDEINERSWDVMIIDECHYLKSDKAARTKYIIGKNGIEAGKRIFLSGTPLLNRPEELWTLARSLDPEGLGNNWQRFHVRYCNAFKSRFGWDKSGASNLEELQEKLRSTFMVRRLKKQVLTDLPDKTRQVIALPPNGDVKLIDAEWAAYRSLEQIREELKQAKSDLTENYEEKVQALRSAEQVAFTEMAAMRKAVALSKVPHVIEHLQSSLAEGPVVLFAHHRDVIRQISEEFPDHVMIIGDTPTAQRGANVEAFQAKQVPLFIAGLRAASEGITLTASSHVVFCELDWTPGRMSQAEDRCHRIGQKNNVLVQHLVLDGSLDSHMARKLVAKQEISDLTLNIN